MATLSHSESRRLYSWWWDSHNSPKNSKWLQENLTDMDGKVKSMIKLIEEDADSFARRAEMYYKKRPELMKLVEEFYRAYRALAERYNHATGELRHAHRTIAKAFPDQVPFELVDDSPSKSSALDREPHTPEMKLPPHALFDPDDFLDYTQGLPDSDIRSMKNSGPYAEDSGLGMRKRGGFKQLNDLFGAKNGNQELKDQILRETERAGKAETEVQSLKKALANMQDEKEDALLQYHKCLKNLSDIEGELNNVQKDSLGLSEKASQAEIEVQTLKEALIQLEVEKSAGFVKQKQYSEKIYDLQAMVSQVQKETRGFDKRAIEAENEAQILKERISRLELDKEEMLQQYKQCLAKISDLENLISNLENKEKLLKKQAEKAEMEVWELKKDLADLNKEKEASAFRYKCCLETISNLEKDLSLAKQDVERLNNEILIGTAKLKTAEEKCGILETSNRSLRVEADNLSKMIAMKDVEVSEKQEKLEKLQTCLQNEQFHHEQIEATLETLQSLHSQSQDEQRALARELQDLLQKLKESEVSKNGLEEEIQHAKDENQTLSRTMENEIISLQEIKEKLEKEVLHHIGLSNSLQQEILHLKEEIKGLNLGYHVLFEQVEDNSKLRQRSEEDKNEKELLSKKLENMEALLKQKIVLESSLSNLSSELENSRETVKALQESCQFLWEEKGTLASEKASLLSQLQPITENMHKLLERNAVLENSLSTAKVELEGLREKSKGLENICELLKNERSFLLSERSSLAFKLENVEGRLESLEKRYMGLESKYADVAKEKEAIHCQAKELEVSLFVEKQERASSKLQSETRLAGLENEIHMLKEENLWKKKEFEEELEKALKAQFEISILQKFMKEMEEKNYSLIIECQKHVEASKLAEKLISELESETLEQQVESELLLDEIERLRFGIYQVFRSLEEEACPDLAPQEKIENEGTFVDHILRTIEDMKFAIGKHEDDKQLLLVENSVLLTLLEQLESKGMEIDAQKIRLAEDFKIMATNLAMVKNEKEKLLEMNKQLKLDVREGHEHNSALEAELGSHCIKHADLYESYTALQKTYSLVNRDNKCLLKKFSDLTEEKFQVDQDNDAVLLEFLTISNQSAVLKSFSMEKIEEVKSLLEDLNRQHEVNGCLEKEMSVVQENLELQKAENVFLKDAVDKFKTEIQEIRECNAEKEAKLLDSELKLEAAETFLCSTVDELNTDIQESLRIRENLEKNLILLSENNSIQKKEIESLHFFNSNLNSELGILCEEMEQKKMRENILNSELHEKKNEFEMWEAEASTFYFDLQISSVREVLFENKVHELAEVCQTLENECASKNTEVEQMKGEICLMNSEVSGLKSQISAYAPVIASLRDNISSLEDNALLRTKLEIKQEPEFLEVSAHPGSFEILREDQTLLSLQNLQARVKTIGKLMEETNKSILQRSKSKKNREESAAMSETEQLKPRRSFGKEKNELSAKKGIAPKLQKIKTKASEIKNGMLMKDIPLDQVSSMSRQGSRKKGNIGKDDQMLELWETAEDGQSQTIRESLRLSYKMTEKDIVYDQFENVKHKSDPPSTDSDVEKELGIVSARSTQANREFNDKKILERLASDAQKLESLQSTVQNLMMKLEANKKIRKVKNVDFDTVNEQLLEADETVVHLVELNGQLLHDIQKCPSPEEKATVQLKEAVKARRRKVTEQARKGSERIGRLQLELQKIQYILLKTEDDKKNKAKNKFFTNKTVILRDFIYNGKKNSGKRKKGPFCGCFRPSASRNGRSISSSSL